jgi:hypothetical protein
MSVSRSIELRHYRGLCACVWKCSNAGATGPGKSACGDHETRVAWVFLAYETAPCCATKEMLSLHQHGPTTKPTSGSVKSDAVS